MDYRPALRERSGVGEYVHQLTRTLAGANTGDRIVAFSSSWRDRVTGEARAALEPAEIVDLRLPVRALTLAWHRLAWPPIEVLTRSQFDVVHSPHPLLLPSRRAAQVVTIHDLDFLVHPERVKAEVRRDYPVLVARHAHRADRIIVPSRHTAEVVARLLHVLPDRVSVCPEGVPEWSPRAGDRTSARAPGYVLFVGTLEPRKNVPGLLEAYGLLLARRPGAPRLVLAGKAPPEAERWLRGLRGSPLDGHVECAGYVEPDARRDLYGDAACLVLPSFDEGFGLPAVEAMSLGIPVVASRRGALPEVVGDAGLLVEPDEPGEIAAAIERVLAEPGLAARLSALGRERARLFTWRTCAELTREAYSLAIEAFRRRTGRLADGLPLRS